MLDDAIKHLPGQHDQSAHGRGGRSGGWENASGHKPANPDGKTTAERYQNSDGSWTPERQELHAKIVDSFFEGKTPVENPTSFMMGGGTASGKSSVLRSGQVKIPENTVKIDPDDIKGKIPEYVAGLKAKHPNAANFAHDESSHISKLIAKRAVDGNYNAMLDGTGDSSLEKLGRKATMMRGAGRKVVASYVTVDTQEAIKRSTARAERTNRVVPESFIRESHANVSRIVPDAVKRGYFDEFTLHDNNGKSPKLAAFAKGNQLNIQDQGLWERFVAKGE